LDREIPRNWRFNTEEDEQKLLDAANPHLRAVIVALLDTAARPGEILSLQWRDVSLGRHELVFRAEKSKTRTERIVPISTRLDAGDAEVGPRRRAVCERRLRLRR
jgi:integrase